jgi:RNA-directed DNA polymerase
VRRVCRITCYRYAACRFERQCLDEWVRRKLRCYHLKQRKRGSSVAGFLRLLGVSATQASRLAGSGKGLWRLALTQQMNAAMSVEWLSQQGIVSPVVKYDSLRH